jgi:WD40 repeat protein
MQGEFKDSVTCLSLKIDSCILTGCIDGSVRLFDMRKGNIPYAASTVVNDDDDGFYDDDND